MKNRVLTSKEWDPLSEAMWEVWEDSNCPEALTRIESFWLGKQPLPLSGAAALALFGNPAQTHLRPYLARGSQSPDRTTWLAADPSMLRRGCGAWLITGSSSGGRKCTPKSMTRHWEFESAKI